MSGVEFDDREVRLLSQDLMAAAAAAPKETRAIVQKGALNIKTDARRRRAGSAHFPRLASAITYDTDSSPLGASAEIGPEQDRPQGNLAHIPEYGSLNTPAQPYMAPAADAEVPKFEQAMTALAARLLGDR